MTRESDHVVAYAGVFGARRGDDHREGEFAHSASLGQPVAAGRTGAQRRAAATDGYGMKRTVS